MLVNKAAFLSCSAVSVCAGVCYMGEHWPGKDIGTFLCHSRPYLSESGPLSESWARCFSQACYPPTTAILSLPLASPGVLSMQETSLTSRECWDSNWSPYGSIIIALSHREPFFQTFCYGCGMVCYTKKSLLETQTCVEAWSPLSRWWEVVGHLRGSDIMRDLYNEGITALSIRE